MEGFVNVGLVDMVYMSFKSNIFLLIFCLAFPSIDESVVLESPTIYMYCYLFLSLGLLIFALYIQAGT